MVYVPMGAENLYNCQEDFIMPSINQLIYEIETLPSEYVQEVINFVGYLKLKRLRNLPETMILSEKTLAKNWDTPEEDEAWANL